MNFPEVMSDLWACTRNDPEMVALLLWFGADPLHFDSRNRTAYDCATTEAGTRRAGTWRYSNAINHPPFITIHGWDSNHQKLVVYYWLYQDFKWGT